MVRPGSVERIPHELPNPGERICPGADRDMAAWWPDARLTRRSSPCFLPPYFVSSYGPVRGDALFRQREEPIHGSEL